MMRRRAIRCAIAAAIAMLCCVTAGCASDQQTDPLVDVANESEGIAATVNGGVVGERAVSAYVANFREAQGLKSDEEWAQWLYDNGYTAEQVRLDTVDYFASRAILRQAALENGVEVTDDEIDAGVAEAREQFADDEAWLDALARLGATESQFRVEVEMGLVQEKLEEAIGEDVAASDEDVLAQVQMYAASYNGAKRSSYILFEPSDVENAQDVLTMVQSGQLDFADAAKEYSADAAIGQQGGDAGWDKMTAREESYQAALDELLPGAVSGLVAGERGLYIIKCTDILEAPNEVTSLDQVSRGFVAYVRDMLDESARQQAFNDWIREYKERSDIQVFDMPEGLPYDVDVAAVLGLLEDEGAGREEGAE